MTAKLEQKTVPSVIAIEGIDRLGKSSLIEGILDSCGHFQVIHFGRPRQLSFYNQVDPAQSPLRCYQVDSFRNSMRLAKSGARIIFDRWHLGEYVYARPYRGYDGSYVFDQELEAGLDQAPGIRLILLVENFDRSCHFVDDGLSLGPVDSRKEEQARFVEAFDRSAIRDKRIICVTDPVTGGFRPRTAILEEALA